MDLIFMAVPVLLKGLWTTLALTAVSVAIGFNLGLGLAIMRGSAKPWIADLCGPTALSCVARRFWCRSS